MSDQHKINKILFLNPPDTSLLENSSATSYVYFEPPLGLLYVYSFIKDRNDQEVKFIDLNIEMKYFSKMTIEDLLENKISDFKPDMIAISALYYSDIHIFHLMAKIIKAVDPNIFVTVGGHYPTHLTEKCLSDKNIDFVILSEGELGLSRLIDALNGTSKLETIEGIAFKNNDTLVKNVRKTFWRGFSNVNRLPWEDTAFEYYFHDSRNVLHRIRNKDSLKIASMTATRGCPHSCTFCSSPSFWRKRWRKRDPSKVIDEIHYLKDNFGVNTVVFNDENIGANKNWFLDFLNAMKTLNITWISGGGLSIRSLNDENIIEKIYESGIGLFNIAVESSSNSMLRKIKKDLRVEETENVIKLIRKYGDAMIIGFFMTGFPFEDWSGVQKTISYAEKLDLDWKSFYCFQPFPGSELYSDCMDNKLMEDFDIHYGENYFAPKLKYIDYTSEDLNRINYTANLKCNFIQNRNLGLKTLKSLEQAERDFRYVLKMAPDHVFAYLGLAEIMRMRNQIDMHTKYIKRASIAKANSDFDWNFYLQEFNIDIDTLYRQ